MNPTQLRTFRTVAATLSFTRSAELLDYAQSSVSSQIRSLEAELGTPLFNRLGRRVALTAAGQRVLAYTDRLQALESEVRAGLQRPGGPALPPAILRLGAPESVMTHWLPPRLAALRAAWPGVQLEYAPHTDAELYHRVLDGRHDFSLLLQPPVHVETLTVRRLSAQPLVVIAAPDHPLAGRRKLAPRHLAERAETVFLTENGCGYRHLFEQELAREGNYAVQRLEFSSVEAIQRCVAQGLGVGFLPQFAVQDLLDAGRLVCLHWEKRFSVDLQLVWHKHKWLSALEDTFVNLCTA